MKTVIILLVALLAIVPACIAQPDSLWSHAYGGAGIDYAYYVVQTEDGGYILSSSTNSFGAGNFDLWVIKTNAEGDTQWCRTFGGSNEERIGNVGPTSDGGYFITGYTLSYGAGNSDFWLVKIDAEGNRLWSHTYGGPQVEHLYWGQQTTDGGFILAGETNSFGGGNYDFWLVKTDANGDSVWSRRFGESADAGATFVVQTADSGFIVTGVIRPPTGGNGDFWLVKADANGDSLWTRTYHRPWDDVPWCVQQTLDSGYIVTGRTALSNGFADVWLVRTNANGDTLWTRMYGEPGTHENAGKVIQTSDECFVIAAGHGMNDLGYPSTGDAWLIRADREGNVLWDQTFGGPGAEVANDVQATPDGGYIVAGFTSSFGAGLYDVWLVKTEPDPLSVDDHPVLQPLSYNLTSYPNPFNPVTEINYSVPQAGPVSLRVYDILGREVAVLVDGFSAPGTYRTIFDGSQLSSGIYLARLQEGAYSQTRKLVLLK